MIIVSSGMGFNRLLTKSGDIPEEWQSTLDGVSGRLLGAEAFLRTEKETDFFGSRDKIVKDADPTKVQEFYLDCLRTIFPVVMNKCVRLTNSKDQTMYLLCFASANRTRR